MESGLNCGLDDLHQRRVSLKPMAGSRAKTLHQKGFSSSPMLASVGNSPSGGHFI